jgi:predicted amidohydrolase YtcJ
VTEPTGEAALVLRGGRITTGVRGAPEATALAVLDGRIAVVGDEAQVQELVDAGARVVDLGGRRVVPGLIDGHLHLVRAGLTWSTEVRWDQVPSLREALGLLAAAARERPPGTWVRVLGGWHHGQFAERRQPTREDLDAVAPDHPVQVQLLYSHAVLNTAALRATGMADADRTPAGAEVERGPDGEPTGVVRGRPAFELCARTAGRLGLDEQIASTRGLLAELAGYGLTGAVDANGIGITPDSYRALYEIWRRGELTLRTRLYLGPTGPGTELDDVRAWVRYAHPGFGDDMLRQVGLGEQTSFAFMDLEGLDPTFRATDAGRADLLEITRLAVEHGFPIHMHAVLDETVSAALDAWEQVDAETPLAGRRFSLCHADAISPRNVRRAAALGLGIGVQNRLVFRGGDSATAWGADVAHTAPPLRDLLDAGIPLGAGTDATVVSSPNPWLSLWWLVTGGTLDGSPPRDASHRLSREEALHLYTTGSAWFSFDEGERGTLEPGRLADLAVLTEDYFEVPDDAIRGLRSVLTLVGGRVVHAHDDLAVAAGP